MKELSIESLTLRIAERTLCRNLNLRVDQNECWGLLGKNGAGKTTLLHSLIGQRKIDAGSIRIDGTHIEQIPHAELATQIGILFQQGVEALPATVFETVMLGRHPHVRSLLWEDERDVFITEQALEAFDLTALRNRNTDSLSGGEMQRVALALLHAQQPSLYLLDEPSNHLDVAFQVKLLSILTKQLAQSSASLMMATHDINLAARFCQKIILLLEDGESLVGSSEEILTEKNLSAAFACDIRSIHSGEAQLFYPR